MVKYLCATCGQIFNKEQEAVKHMNSLDDHIVIFNSEIFYKRKRLSKYLFWLIFAAIVAFIILVINYTSIF